MKKSSFLIKQELGLFNQQNTDQMTLFGTKAETLDRLSPLVKMAKILPQISLTLEEYRENQKNLLERLEDVGWIDQPLIIRSSAEAEDQQDRSLAGCYTSVLNVKGRKEITAAIERVIDSFDSQSLNDQVLIQPMLQSVILSGVAFSKNPSSGSPYILVNYDDTSGKTDSVTSGQTNALKAYIHYRYTNFLPPQPFDRIVQLIFELEHYLQTENLDIEFSMSEDGELYLLQVRPLILPNLPSLSASEHTKSLKLIYHKIQKSYGPHPYLHGSHTIYGIMPDWNPAEIIGVRPKPLAFSLYKEIITDHIWAYQRDNYGYCNLRSFPLLINFHGLPYVDVRVSFNSFIPKTLDPSIAGKLVDYYLEQLRKFPNFHDKVEFEIIYSCYTLDLPERLQVLKNEGFNDDELNSIMTHLRELTNKIINEASGLWRADYEKIDILEERYHIMMLSQLDPVSKIYWLLEDCKRYGTLPFAGLARAGFIAIQLLKSLISTGIIHLEEYHHFLQSLDTISSRLGLDLQQMPRGLFLEKYGHLRPGTYDVLSARYDEEPELYFNSEADSRDPVLKQTTFHLSLSQIKQIEDLLKKHGLAHNIISFFDFIKAAIEGREYSKFIFSRHLSSCLSLIKQLGSDYGISPEECAFINIACLKQIYSSSQDIEAAIRKSIEEGKEAYSKTKELMLPPLIHDPKQVFSFSIPIAEPNFITLKRIQGPTARASDEKSNLKGSIVLIPSADPGYDWIFSHGISGLITMYGGMNSHMAIRSGELGIPAVIGAGETLYAQWEKAQCLEIDCANCQVRIVR